MSVEGIYLRREAMRPTPRTWVKHTVLLLVTLATATIAGVLQPFGRLPLLMPDPRSWGEVLDLVVILPWYYAATIVNAINGLLSDPQILSDGLSFSLSLLFILISHEMGHYVACRIYGVDATLPYFIPTPPMIGPAGTFGAFIRIMSPMPSRKAVFDIGVAGPIVGFIALIPIAVAGLATMRPAPVEQLGNPGALVFSDPLFMQIVGCLFRKDPSLGFGNLFYFAAWLC